MVNRCHVPIYKWVCQNIHIQVIVNTWSELLAPIQPTMWRLARSLCLVSGLAMVFSHYILLSCTFLNGNLKLLSSAILALRRHTPRYLGFQCSCDTSLDGVITYGRKYRRQVGGREGGVCIICRNVEAPWPIVVRRHHEAIHDLLMVQERRVYGDNHTTFTVHSIHLAQWLSQWVGKTCLGYNRLAMRNKPRKCSPSIQRKL